MRAFLGAVGLMLVVLVGSGLAQEFEDITLPAPRTEGGMSLMQALALRQSSRAFSDADLPVQVMADLLWAAAGINRMESGKRTAPSARNWQEVMVYVVTEHGAYIYDARANVLRAVASRDLRGSIGMQDFVSVAPVNLVYVADVSRMKGVAPDDEALYAGADTGFIAQNVYLFCASQGLATVVRGSVDRESLGKALNLRDDQKVILAQTVGYPAAGAGE